MPILPGDNTQRAVKNGPLLMVLASLAFTLMVTMVKIVRVDYGFGAMEIIMWRALFSIPLVWWMVGLRWQVQGVGMLLIRSLFGFAAMFSFFSAAKGLGVGELSVLVKLQPLGVALLAPLWLGVGERGGPRVWGAMGLGLLGTVVLLWPDLRWQAGQEGHLRAAAWGLSAAACSTVAHTAVRGLGATDDPKVVVFWFQNVIGVGAVATLWAEGRWPHMHGDMILWLLLVGIGLSAAAGQLLMTRAYQAAPAPQVAAASYVAPLFGFLMDFLWFGAALGWSPLVGGVLVVLGGGLLVWSPRR